MKSKTSLVLSLVLIAILFFIAGTLEITKRYKTVEIPQTTDKLNYSRLQISKLGLDLPIFSSTQVNGMVSTIDNGVQALEVAPQKTNLVIYGHNWHNLLGTINKLQKHDEIIVATDSGELAVYEVVGSYEVTPNQTHVLKQTQDQRITLITCSGFLDSKRLVVVGKLVTKPFVAVTSDSQSREF